MSLKDHTDQFAQQFADCPGNGGFIVAYSGGLDSTVLLHLMAALREQRARFADLRAVHIHHGQSDQADQWVSHCGAVCAKLAIPLDIHRVNIQDAGASVENRLRQARYKVFAHQLADRDILLTAHHADDQTETLLYRLARGAGMSGMSGIPKCRPLGSGWLFRPLLQYERKQLRELAAAAHLSWVEDESNLRTRFDRNYLRKAVLPQLSSRWPGIHQAAARQAMINRQSQEALDYLLQPLLKSLQADGPGLNIRELLRVPESVQVNILRTWLAEQGTQGISYNHYHRLLREVAGASADANPELNTGSLVFRRYQGRLLVQPQFAALDTQGTWQWDPNEPLEIPGVGSLAAVPASVTDQSLPLLRLPRSSKGFKIRFRQGGERCRPIGRSGSRSLKKLLQEHHVPPWLRERVPLVYEGDELLAVADFCVCQAGAAAPSETGLVLSWQRAFE